jgi:hypothetical protein
LGADFSSWSVPRTYKGRQLGRPSPFCTGVCGEGTWAHVAGESPLLEAVAGERLVKTRRAGGDLAGAVGIDGSALIACSSESCVRLVRECIHQSKPRLWPHIHVTILRVLSSRIESKPTFGRVIALAVSRRLSTAAARVRARVRSCGICGGPIGTGAGFLRVLRFPLPILIPPIALQ